MKNLITLFLLLIFSHILIAQTPTKSSEKSQEIKKDNYTVQYLIILNDKNEVLLQKNQAGWHTIALRSNENQSIKEVWIV